MVEKVEKGKTYYYFCERKLDPGSMDVVPLTFISKSERNYYFDVPKGFNSPGGLPTLRDVYSTLAAAHYYRLEILHDMVKESEHAICYEEEIKPRLLAERKANESIKH